MAETIRVEPEALDQAAGQIEGWSSDYQNNINLFYSTVEELGSTWVGADYDAFKNKMEEFRDDFNNMKTEMDQYAQHLRNSASAYRTAQDDARTRATSLSGNYR